MSKNAPYQRVFDQQLTRITYKGGAIYTLFLSLIHPSQFSILNQWIEKNNEKKLIKMCKK